MKWNYKTKERILIFIKSCIHDIQNRKLSRDVIKDRKTYLIMSSMVATTRSMGENYGRI